MAITCKIVEKKPLSHRLVLQPDSKEDKQLANEIDLKREKVILLTMTEYLALRGGRQD
jgi:hypothetical protein